METFCSQHSEELTNKLIIKHFYYSDKFKLVYCYVPKGRCMGSSHEKLAWEV